MGKQIGIEGGFNHVVDVAAHSPSKGLQDVAKEAVVSADGLVGESSQPRQAYDEDRTLVVMAYTQALLGAEALMGVEALLEDEVVHQPATY